MLVFLTFLACNKARKEKETIPNEIQTSAKSAPTEGAEGIDAILKNSFIPEWFSGRGTLSATLNGGNMELDINLLLRRDSAILLVLKKFGFEGARALITPDSVFLINRLEQNYDKMPLSFLSEKFNLPAQFQSIQELLMGIPSSLDGVNPLVLHAQDSLFVLSANSKKIDASYQISKSSLNLLSAFFEEAGTAAKMTMIYENYRKSNLNRDFSFDRTLKFFSPDSGSGEVQLIFEDAEFNIPKTIRFQIPAHYRRKSYLKE